VEIDRRLIERLSMTVRDENGPVIIRSGISNRIFGAEYSFGIEEEYFLGDAKTLDVRHRTPEDFFRALDLSTGGQSMQEMLQAQMEVATNVHVDVRDAREELKFLRQEAGKVAAQFGLAIMACGTHPTALWRDSQLTPKARYQSMVEDLRIVGYRNMLCGMHVHVALPDPSKRLNVMCAMIPYLPMFIALACSSPFWNGHATGLKGYRLAAYDELPRTGLPELFCTEDEYNGYVQTLVQSGVMPDESYIWWAMRPSMRHPTLELRATDCCTKADDAIAIASLYRALARHLFLQIETKKRVTVLDRAIADENKWRAQRYGVECTFVTEAGPMHLADYLRRVIDMVSDDAEHLQCREEIERCKAIAGSGSSADDQLRAASTEGSIEAAKNYIATTTLEFT